MSPYNNRSTQEEKGRIFTDKQREFLNGGNELSKYRTETWQRVVGALKDIQLFTQLDEGQRRRIYNSAHSRPNDQLDLFTDRPDLFTKEYHKKGVGGLTNAYVDFTKFYLSTAVFDNTFNGPSDLAPIIEWATEEHLRDLYGSDKSVNVSVDITPEIQDIDLTDAKRRLENEGLLGIDSDELHALAEAGEIEISREEGESVRESVEIK